MNVSSHGDEWSLLKENNVLFVQQWAYRSYSAYRQQQKHARAALLATGQVCCSLALSCDGRSSRPTVSLCSLTWMCLIAGTPAVLYGIVMFPAELKKMTPSSTLTPWHGRRKKKKTRKLLSGNPGWFYRNLLFMVNIGSVVVHIDDFSIAAITHWMQWHRPQNLHASIRPFIYFF